METGYHKGSSLITVIIILALIGIFGYLVFDRLQPSMYLAQVRDEQRKKDLQLIQKGIEEYYKEKGIYPLQGPSYRISMGRQSESINWGEQWRPYLEKLPKDPDKNRTYVYYSTIDRQSYYLYASLEKGAEDQDTCKTFDTVCEGVKEKGITENACGQLCNYGLSSPNVSP